MKFSNWYSSSFFQSQFPCLFSLVLRGQPTSCPRRILSRTLLPWSRQVPPGPTSSGHPHLLCPHSQNALWLPVSLDHSSRLQVPGGIIQLAKVRLPTLLAQPGVRENRNMALGCQKVWKPPGQMPCTWREDSQVPQTHVTRIQLHSQVAGAAAGSSGKLIKSQLFLSSCYC